jgi:hypothetical protein
MTLAPRVSASGVVRPGRKKSKASARPPAEGRGLRVADWADASAPAQRREARTGRPLATIQARQLEYERRKAAWAAANPGASSAEYERAVRAIAAEIRI